MTVDPAMAKLAAREESANRSLAGFVSLMWREIEPSRKLLWSWHHQLICDELEAIDHRPIAPAKSADLVICVPPGHGKSMLVSVFWPTWRWLRSSVEPHRGGSGSLIVAAAHIEGLALRDSRRARDLTNTATFLRLAARSALASGEARWTTGQDANRASKDSRGSAVGHRETTGVPSSCDPHRPWEALGAWRSNSDRWPLLVQARGIGEGRLWWAAQQVAHDQSGRANFGLPGGGGRIGVGVRADITGRRADLAILDDPTDARDVLLSGAARAAEKVQIAVDWYDGVLSTRMNPGAPRVVVMQRLHESDLAGTLIARGARHVVLPALWEDGRTDTHARDPRQGGPDGVHLWPAVYPRERVEALAVALGTWGAAAQLWQRPSPKGGGSFQAVWFRRRYHADPRDLGSALARIFGEVAITVDTSGGSKRKGASNNSMQVWGLGPPAWGGHGGIWPVVDDGCKPGDRYLLDDEGGKWELPELERRFRALVKRWPTVRLILIENKALGAALLQVCTDLVLVPINPVGDKMTRSGYTQRAAEADKVVLPSAEVAAVLHPERPRWADDWLAEHLAFGAGGARDDRVDAASQLHHHWLQDEVDPTGSVDWMETLLNDVERGGL